jgi:steroid delta-isomerase-like uncharacterized protein
MNYSSILTLAPIARQYGGGAFAERGRVMGSPHVEGTENLVARWARAWSTRNTGLFLGLFAEDASYCDVALDKTFRGREAIKAFFEGTFATFPDFKMDAVCCAVTADTAAGEWVMSGTFLGESFGQAPTGKSFRVEGCCFMRIAGGRIVLHRDYWNPTTFDAQVAP